MATRIVVLTVLLLCVTTCNSLPAAQTNATPEGPSPKNLLIHNAPKHPQVNSSAPPATPKGASVRDPAYTEVLVKLAQIEATQAALSDKLADTKGSLKEGIDTANKGLEAQITLLKELGTIIIGLLVAIFGAALVIWKKLVRLETELKGVMARETKSLHRPRSDFE